MSVCVISRSIFRWPQALPLGALPAWIRIFPQLCVLICLCETASAQILKINALVSVGFFFFFFFLFIMTPSYVAFSLMLAECCGEQKTQNKVIRNGKELHTLSVSLLFSLSLLQLPEITEAAKAMPAFHLGAPHVKLSHNLFHLSAFLCVCRALLEQLNRLQALSPNSSCKTTNRGTCILVRPNAAALLFTPRRNCSDTPDTKSDTVKMYETLEGHQ